MVKATIIVLCLWMYIHSHLRWLDEGIKQNSVKDLIDNYSMHDKVFGSAKETETKHTSFNQQQSIYSDDSKKQGILT